MKEVKAYKCDYCHRCFGRKQNARMHEDNCKNNPAMRHCRTCIHGVKAVVDRIPIEAGLDAVSYAAHCGLYKMPVHDKPYFIDCDVSDCYGHTIEIPGTCNEYQYRGYAGWPLANQDMIPYEEITAGAIRQSAEEANT